MESVFFFSSAHLFHIFLKYTDNLLLQSKALVRKYNKELLITKKILGNENILINFYFKRGKD